MAAISNVSNIQMPPPPPQGQKRKEPPPTPMSAAERKKLLKLDQDPFIQKLKAVKQDAKDRDLRMLGSGCGMTAWFDPSSGRAFKCFSYPPLTEDKRGYMNVDVMQQNMAQEIRRYLELQQVFGRVATIHNRNPLEDAYYEQTYIPDPLPAAETLPPDIKSDLVFIMRHFYRKGLLLDVSPNNFGYLNGEMYCFDFGLGYSNESEERGSSHKVEYYQGHIAATFAGYLNDWENLYPGARGEIAEEFIESDPLLYQILKPKPRQYLQPNPLLPDLSAFA